MGGGVSAVGERFVCGRWAKPSAALSCALYKQALSNVGTSACRVLGVCLCKRGVGRCNEARRKWGVERGGGGGSCRREKGCRTKAAAATRR